MKKKQLEKGGSWYEGKFEYSTDEPVKLSKAEKSRKNKELNFPLFVFN